MLKKRSIVLEESLVIEGQPCEISSDIPVETQVNGDGSHDKEKDLEFPPLNQLLSSCKFQKGSIHIKGSKKKQKSHVEFPSCSVAEKDKDDESYQSMDEKEEAMNLAFTPTSKDNHDVDDCGCMMCDNLSKKIHGKRKIKDKSIASKFMGIDRKIKARSIIHSKGRKKKQSQSAGPSDVPLNLISDVDGNNLNLSPIRKKNFFSDLGFSEESENE